MGQSLMQMHSRVLDMLGIKKNGLEYNLVRGVIEDKLNVVAGQRTIMTFKTKSFRR